MKTRLAAAAAILLSGTPGSAHRLDEYLQAALISVDKNRVQAEVHLTPGVAVFPIVLANMDTDADGVISEAEQHAYAERVLRDVLLSIDGSRLRLQLVSMKFDKIEEMKEGRGEIQLEFNAAVPSGGPNRTLIFENHHQSGISAYLVNCLVPSGPDIRVVRQDRNFQQSFYQLDYVEAGVRSYSPFFAWRSASGTWLGAVALLLFARFALLWRQRA